MTPRKPSSGPLAPVAACALAVLAGCTTVSLNQPQVVDWSTGAPPSVTQVSPSEAPVASAPTYVVRRDDTLASIAQRFGTTPAQLAAWNALAPNTRVRPDQVLRVGPPPPPPDSAPVATPQPIGNEGVEARPIGQPDATSSALPSASSAAASVASSNAPLKTGPLGVRRPYADATLAELSRSDVEGAPPPVASISPPPATPPAAAATSGVTWGWPTAARPAGGFDEKAKGIDFAGKSGDPVLAAADGRVTFAGTGVRGYGNFVIVQHSPDLLSVYAHNRANLVKEGATVVKGQKIAEMGNTDADAVKLHFEIRRDSKPVDPLQYLPPR